MDVIKDKEKEENEENLGSSFEIGSELASLPCSLPMGLETSPYTIFKVIREARRVDRNVKQGLAFLLAVHIAMSLLMLLNFVLLLPPIFNGYQIIWVLWVIVPIMTISNLWTPHEVDVMNQLPVKNVDHLHDFSRFFKYFLLRVSPVILMCQAIFVVALKSWANVDLRTTFVGLYPLVTYTEQLQWALLYAQVVTLFFFVLYMRKCPFFPSPFDPRCHFFPYTSGGLHELYPPHPLDLSVQSLPECTLGGLRCHLVAISPPPLYFYLLTLTDLFLSLV